MLVPWSVLQPSLRARRLRVTALALAGLSCVVLFRAAFAAEPFDTNRLLLAVFVAMGCLLAGRRARHRQPLEVGVASDGEVKLRRRRSSDRAPIDEDESLHSMPVRVSFAAPWLISLHSGTMLVPIWPDCLPPTVFRQLWVHLHWGRAAPRDDDGKTMPRDKFMAR